MARLQPRFRDEQIGIITSFIRHVLEDSGYRGLVVGMSGGLDSSLVAKLCADAVGANKVVGVWSGEGPAKGRDYQDTQDWSRVLGIELRRIDISPLVDDFGRSLKIRKSERLAFGNIKARVRMIILYYIANTEKRLVMGTGNKSEIATAYYSKFGDGGVDFLPIGDLYKTQVREMAAHLGVPKRIIGKIPTAGLWAGQTDEDELSVRYEVLDRILLGIELHLTPEEIVSQADVDFKVVQHVEKLVASGVHKRKPPLIPKVGIRTFGLDWRE